VKIVTIICALVAVRNSVTLLLLCAVVYHFDQCTKQHKGDIRSGNDSIVSALYLDRNATSACGAESGSEPVCRIA
jgi:hypothetical protein